jgi:hypothetical protein
MKYIVGSNMPGYMPDAEPYEAQDLAHAHECLSEDLFHYTESDSMDGFTEGEVVQMWNTVLEFQEAEPQACNVYIGDYVFWIAEG